MYYIASMAYFSPSRTDVATLSHLQMASYEASRHVSDTDMVIVCVEQMNCVP